MAYWTVLQGDGAGGYRRIYLIHRSIVRCRGWMESLSCIYRPELLQWKLHDYCDGRNELHLTMPLVWK